MKNALSLLVTLFAVAGAEAVPPPVLAPAVGPLMFLFGTETEAVLRQTVNEIADGGNQMLTAESRHHADWYGPTWWRDLNIICDEAKKRNLKVVLFDDPWFQSQMMKGRVPVAFAARMLQTEEMVDGQDVEAECLDEFVLAVEGTWTEQGFLPETLREVKGVWKRSVPGQKCYRFRAVPKGRLINGFPREQFSVDGLSEAAVDWFIDYVYSRHYREMRPYFDDGTIVGFFFDEPETHGDWGPALAAELERRGVDRVKALVAMKLKLAGGEEAAYRHAFMDARVETWGCVMYGRISQWCQAHGVFFTGHFMEHAPVRRWFYGYEHCCGNVMQLLKYQDVPGVDLVCGQLFPGERARWEHYQMPKIVSSIAHTYEKPGDRAMCEIFGAYGTKLNATNMFALADHHLVRGVNVLIPHAYTTRVGHDIKWYGPYYNEGDWPKIYPAWAKHVKEVAAATTEGRHSAQIAFVHVGLDFMLGKAAEVEAMTTLIQDAHYDCDWINQELLAKATIHDRQLRIGHEDYPVLMLPGLDVMPYALLEKAKEFLDQGGIVLSHAYRPTHSATIGRTDTEVVALAKAIFDGGNPRAIALPPVAHPDPFPQLRALGVKPTIEIVGDGAKMVRVLRRETDTGSTYFLVNENVSQGAKRFKVTFTAENDTQVLDLPPLASKVVRVNKSK